MFRYLVIGLALTGCYSIQYGNRQTEVAKVTDRFYMADQSSVNPGMTSDGDFVMVFDSKPAKWNTEFRYQHGRFMISGEEVFNKTENNKSYEIAYQEKYKVYKDHIILDGYHFLGIDREIP